MSKFVALFCILSFLCVAYVMTRDLQCRNGYWYQENNCNCCYCKNGKLQACTRKNCEGKSYEKRKQCALNTIWMQNKCMCVKDHGTICLSNACTR